MLPMALISEAGVRFEQPALAHDSVAQVLHTRAPGFRLVQEFASSAFSYAAR